MSDQPERPGSLAVALITLQTRLPRITKDAEGQAGQRVTKYLSLSALHAIVMPLLAELGLYWYCCPTLNDDGKFILAYRLGHVGGDLITGSYPLPESGGSQALGSAITYARRYALTAVLGIAPADDDDDGHAAQTEWRPPANPRTRKATRHRADRDGPLPDDEWTEDRTEEDAPGSILPDQRTKIMILFGKAGIRSHEDRLAYTLHKIDNLPEDYDTSNKLSMRQAGQLIAYLEAERNT